MKALTIRQPYAWLIVAGHKDVENRSWSTKYRGPLLIHAGVQPHSNPLNDIEERYGVRIPSSVLQFGGVIGCVDLIAVTTASPSPWFDGPYGFVLANPRSVAFTPCRGLQRFFEIELGA